MPPVAVQKQHLLSLAETFPSCVRAYVIQGAALLRMDEVGISTAVPLVVEVHQRQLPGPVLEHHLHRTSAIPASPVTSVARCTNKQPAVPQHSNLNKLLEVLGRR